MSTTLNTLPVVEIIDKHSGYEEEHEKPFNSRRVEIFVDDWPLHFLASTSTASICTHIGCSQCDFKTKNNEKLAEHVLSVHPQPEEGKKRFNCDHCSYGTNRSDHFKRHSLCRHGVASDKLTDHEENEPAEKDLKSVRYRCQHCPYGTNRADHFTRHLLCLHGVDKKGESGVKFSCPECDYQTFRKDKLKRHIMRLHSSSPVATPPK